MRDGEELAIIAGTAEEVADEARKIAATAAAARASGQGGAAPAGPLETPPVAPAGV
jgi:nitroimidazol reductase NimA-like FMN-containing flavoprotein (pyridoxamine 5'-phosphate oxidase superfamily)